MFCAFSGAGLGNFLRCKLTKHHFTLFLGIVSSVALACLVYAGFLKIAEVAWGVSVQHEAGYICAMLFIIPGFPFITSGIDLAKLDMRSGVERFTYALIVVLVATMSAWKKCHCHWKRGFCFGFWRVSVECLVSLLCLTVRFVWLRLQQGSEQLQIRSGWSWWILRHVHRQQRHSWGLWLQVCWLL